MDHALYRVISFKVVGPFALDVGFDDGTRRTIDFRPVLRGELYSPLRDVSMFQRVRIDPDAHTLVWPNGADFDPATLHDWPAAGQRMIELARRWEDTEARARCVAHRAPSRHRIIGVDCATRDANVGLALAELDNDGLRLENATAGDRRRPARSIVEEWLTGSEDVSLLAIDAPLGWPRPLVTSLTSHSAGTAIETPADDMFRRTTDAFIKRQMGKTPLDVGADRIARTAHAALRLLGELRYELDIAIPLAWEPSQVTCHAAIEVYPAATLMAHGIRSGGYKKPHQIRERSEMVEALRPKMALSERDVGDLTGNADLLDAAVCVLAASDFLTGRAVPPPDRGVAEDEGWIWTALPQDAIYTAPHE